MQTHCLRGMLLFVLMLTVAALASAKPVMPAYYVEMSAIVQRTNLSKADKLKKIQPYLQRSESRMAALAFTLQLDRQAAREAAISHFRASATPRVEKLSLGQFILTRTSAGDFQDEYGKFLLQAVLNGEKEFMRAREQGTVTAVGEYADIAAGFNGYKPALFERMKDQRVIPVLIRCLQAPDEVYPQDQGCVVRGKPGEPTGRDTARQNIPVALARLAAVSAVDELRQVMRDHHDAYLRSNAAYALGRLIKTAEIDNYTREIAALKRVPDRRLLLFPFGKGLIERGEVARGIGFLSFENSVYRDSRETGAILYMLGERLTILHGVRHPATISFYREALTYAPLKSIFLAAEPPQADQQSKMAAESYQRLLTEIRENHLTSLAPLITEIAAKTKNPEIRQASEQLLDEFKRKDKQ